MARRRARRKHAVESLELRSLLAGDVVISEIVAANGASLLDEDQESSDWLELHNTTDQVIDLNGWHLTDDRRELTKWQLPAVTLQPDEYRVVFASGKDRAPLDGNLHTNFRLSADGEYTALVRPDGRTIEDAFDPGFPPQSQDVAYGRGAATRSVVVDGHSTFRYWVPGDGALEVPVQGAPAWTQADFDASSWPAGQAGFGFDQPRAQGVVVSPVSVQLTSGATAVGTVANLINQSSPYLSPLPHSAQTVHSSVDETAGSWLATGPSELTMQLLFASTFDHLLLWNFSYFDPALGLDTQQGSGVKDFAVSFSADGVNYSGEQTFTTAAPVVGQPVPLEQFDVGQQSARFIKLRTINSHDGILQGLGEIAFSRGTLFDPDSGYNADYVVTDLTTAMYDADRSSAYFRTSFDVTDPESVADMSLRMRFDDGFIAYLNGVEVTRANAPEGAVWNSSATANRSSGDAIEFADFDISGFRQLLRESGNVLAVQGFNAAVDRSNFLFHPELEIVGSDPVTVGFLASPTPGAANSPRLGAPVHFSVSGGVLDQDRRVELSVDNVFDAIRYTTDGSDPDETSAVYTQPVLISSTTELKARSFTPGGTAGLVRREAYVKFADDLKSFDSNLPIFVIESFGSSIPSAVTLRSTYSLVFDVAEASGRAAVSDVPHYAGRSGIRQRGRSSAGFAQKQYKYETWDQDGNDADVPLLGLPAESDWVLNGPYTDKSLMRNVVSFKWWEDLGYYSPRTRFVEVFLNTDGDDEVSYADDYVGVYVLIESIKIGQNRVNIQTPEATTDISQLTGGYVIEVGNPGQFTTRVSGRSIGYQYEDPGPRELNTAQRTWIKDYIEEFETALYSPDFTNPETGKHYSEYIDVSSFVDYRIMREFTRDFDGGSTYLFIDRGGVITMGPLWDMNWALGNVDYAEPGTVDRCGCDIEGWNYSYTTPTIPSWPAWSVRLQEDPDHWQLIVDRWHELRQTVLRDESFLADIDANFQLLAVEAANRNFERWRTLGQHTVISPPGYRERDTYEKEVQYLRDWLVQHAAWLDAQFVPPPTLGHAGGAVDAGSLLSIDSLPAPTGTKLVRQGDEARVKIATDDSLGDSWTQLDFQPNAEWLAGSTGVGFDNSEGYKSITGFDIRATMRTNRSALIRMEFDFDRNPLDVAALNLNMRYDDGFVAFLNGTEIARSQSVTNGTPGSARAQTHEAYDFESFDVSQFKTALQAGRNVLAIHGINASAASTDFLIIPELVAELSGEVPGRLPVYYTTDGSDPRLPGGQPNPTARIYTNSVRIDAEMTVQARTMQEGAWSALVGGTYLVGTVPASATNLRISEVHFHPVAADLTQGELDVDQEQFEFIELVNIGSQSIDLSHVRLLEVDVDGAPQGVEFTFGVASLAPAMRIVVVKDRAAFTSRYGSQVRVAGEFSGQLANGGERLTLVAADGSSIQRFSYDDGAGWPETPDGLGASLQVIDYNGDYNQGSNWRGSAAQHGTPGRAEYMPGDANLDGKFNSQDLIQVLAAGKYEDSIPNNASWLEGDWNGDREVDSLDLVLALTQGNYSAADAIPPALDALMLSEIASEVALRERKPKSGAA